MSPSLDWHGVNLIGFRLYCRCSLQYKLCVLVHRYLNGAAPQYLTELVQPLSVSRRPLRSASTAEVLVPATRRATISDRAFAIFVELCLCCLRLSKYVLFTLHYIT